MFVPINIGIKVRKNLLKDYVWNVVLDGSEIWIIGKTEEKIHLMIEI